MDTQLCIIGKYGMSFHGILMARFPVSVCQTGGAPACKAWKKLLAIDS